ncbi:replication initiator [Parafrankia sp. EUN1f]|uniref:replication initiator n=1 Tax=Parafrankia sp. EUN1f TaxID=102897 RepID=UPI0001C45F08|nr:replication initiator [Parafrankia sp. EUN1f]EFC81784.1 hypothetical protein FrEUN1fDRAFT_5107 [Parafrankia sp. EUN1f]
MTGDGFPTLTPAMREVLAQANGPDFARWTAIAKGVHGCARPVRLIGDELTVHTGTGEVIDRYSTTDEPTGYLLTACGNRRAAVCPACSRIYQADTFHLIRAGLIGGKGVPESVRLHPRLFVTLTAPSFGPVHARRERNGRLLPCRPRRQRPACAHGRPQWCDERHEPGDPRIGQPLCAGCFDYDGAVLWNAHVGLLWQRFTIYLRRRLADHAGISRTRLSQELRVSFAKVAEFQARGLVHLHALIRLDGPEGGSERPPEWATLAVLGEAVHQAAEEVRLSVPGGPDEAEPSRTLRWGDQLDTRAVLTAASDDRTADEKVAGYIAKYATKGAEVSGTVHHRIRAAADIEHLDVTDHARAMIQTCWRLGGMPEHSELNLRRWAHMLGFRGHFGTRSRRYSTTLGALRGARSAERAENARVLQGLPAPGDEQTARVGRWRYAGSGYTPGQALIAGVDTPEDLAG